MNRVLRLTLLGVGLLFVAFTMGCGGGGSARLRVMNASPDEFNLDVTVDNSTFASNLAYGTSTLYRSVKSGSRRIQMEPSGIPGAIIDQNVALNSKSDTTVVAMDYSTSIRAVAFTDDNSLPGGGGVKIRAINALPGIALVDVYVVAPGTDLFSVEPNSINLAFESATEYITTSAGDREVFFTLPGQKVSLIDSGPFIAAAGKIRTVVGLNSQAGGYAIAILLDN